MQAWDKFLEIKHACKEKQHQSEEVQELLNKLLQDLQSITEGVADLFNTPSSYIAYLILIDDDDDEYSFATQEYLMTCSTAITPDSPKTDSLIMEDEHLDTIPETESDEFIKSSVEDLVQNPSESEDERECDVPDCDDSQTINFSTFSNPLFDDSSSSDDESSHEEVIHEMSFKTYSNPLFDLDKEIISSEFNPIHNEDLDSTPKDVRFDAESYLLESLVNRDTLMASPPKIDFLLDEFTGELTRLQSIPPGIDNINLDPEGDSTINVVEDIPVDVPNILPTHPAFNWISIHSFLVIRIVSLKFLILPEIEHDLRSGICIEVESTRFLAPLSPVINTLLPFSSENEDKVFNHGVLAYKEKSPSSKNSPKPSGLKLSSFS
ncbi:hypothetical protein Tco_0405262 [Tanacetum coccineum]